MMVILSKRVMGSLREGEPILRAIERAGGDPQLFRPAGDVPKLHQA
jgi:hypothetical protein